MSRFVDIAQVSFLDYGLLRSGTVCVCWFLNIIRTKLGGGFKYFLFSPLLGEDSHFD